MSELPQDDSPTRSRRFKLIFFLLTLALLTPAFAQDAAQASSASGGISGAQIALLVVLLALSGVLSGSETALTAVGEWKIRQIREEGDDPNGVFALLERDRARFITTLLIGNNLVNIAATALVTQIALGLAASLGAAESLAVAYATGVMTLLVLIFGEITPKSFAVHNAVPMSRVILRPVYYLSVFLYPLGLFFTFLANGVLRLLRLEPAEGPVITENELRLMLRSAEESGVIEAQEQEMIRGIIDLEETVVREVMTPRVDVVAVSEESSLEEILALVTQHGYSRLPVYAETIDNVRGLVYARDLLAYLGRPDDLAATCASDIMTSPQYVPETLSILNLLKDMRTRKNHMAIVVDEFGGTAGLVTLEDIIEEVTGEIYDETDTEEDEEIQALEEGHYRIQGSAHLEDVGVELDLIFDDDGEYDTLAGFLVSRFGYIPEPGETYDFSAYQFIVEEADERRIISTYAAPAEGAVSEPTEAQTEAQADDVPRGA